MATEGSRELLARGLLEARAGMVIKSRKKKRKPKAQKGTLSGY